MILLQFEGLASGKTASTHALLPVDIQTKIIQIIAQRCKEQIESAMDV